MTASLLPALLLLASAGAAPGSPRKPETPATPEPPAVTGAERKKPGPRSIPGLKSGKLVVSADGARRRQLGRDRQGAELSRVTFAGNVKATRGELKLSCRDLVVTFAKPEAGPGRKSKTEPREACASGDVVIRTPRRKAIAEKASYELATEKLTLSGRKRPVIYQDGDAVAAESFVFRRARGVFEARGRTVAVILPRKKPGRKPDEETAPPGPDEKPGPSLARKTRIDCAGGAVYEDARHRLFLRREVLVRQKGLALSCDRLWVIFSAREKKKPGQEPEKKSGPVGKDPLADSFGPGSVSRIVAAGNVRVRGEGRTGEAEIAEYDPVRKTVTLGGRKTAPVIHDGDNYLTAPLIVYHLGSGRLESPNGRLKVVVRIE